MKNDLAVLNVIAANKWQRPIYFTSPFNELGFARYLRAEGLSYHLVPAQPQKDNNVDNDLVFKNMMGDQFRFGNAQTPGVYFDEENRRHLLTIRQAYAAAAESMAEDGRKEEARELLEKSDKGMDQGNMPYAMVSRSNQHNIVSISMMEAAYKAESNELAGRILDAVKKDLTQQLSYYAALGNMSVPELMQHIQQQNADALNNKQRGMYSEIDQAFRVQNYLNFLEAQYKPEAGNTETPAVINTTGPDSAAKPDSSK